MAVHQLQNHEHNQLPLYQTLKQCQGQRQIRLIFLDTGDHVAEDAPVTCGLSPWALNEVKTPRYIALSYVWGPPDTSQSIVVNGQSFKVSANLLNFLKSHRRRCTDNPELRKMPLWIDNVCINQADTKERSHQVSLMKSIYQNASMVISWLGPSFPFSDWTFGVLRSFKEQIDRTHIAVDSDLTSIQLKVTDASWLSLFPQACKSDPSLGTTLRSVVWDSIRELCEHIYWRRVWVFQELVLGDIVMLSCGDDVIPIRDVLHVMRWLSGLNATLEKPDQMAEEVWNMISSREVSERALGMKSILQVWEARQLWRTGGSPITRMYSDLEATDPRDKIYGSLGMTGLNIVPDYSKSVQDVYVEAAKTVMEERFETLLALSGRQTSRSQPIEPLEIPSWVPDWRQSAPGFCSLNHPFTASKNSPTCPAPIIEGYNLYCSGVVCDDVVEIEPVLEPGDCLKFCCDYIGSRTTDRYPTGIPHLRALFLILLADWDTMIDCRSEPESMVYQVIACGLIHLFLSSEISYRARNGRPQISNPFSALGLGAIQSDLATTFWNKVVGTSSEPSNCVITGRYDQQSAAMSAIGERLASTVQAALKPALLNRKIFHTKNGYMGIGSDSVQPGDKVCVAFGCNVPIIFRPQDPYYTCISPCYIVGLMEGEAMLARHDTQRFEIR